MGKRSTRRRRSAWASITEVDAGERYRIRYWAETPSGYRRCSETVRGTRRDAERRRAELMLEHSEDAPCPTVGQAWERWYLPALDRRVEVGELAPLSRKNFVSGWNAHVSRRWADVPCDQIRPLAVQQWLDQSTYNGAVRGMDVLRPLLDYAVRYGYIASNPFRERYIMPSRSTVAERDRGIWTLQELGEVWRSVRGQWYEAAFLLSAFGGLRVGESLGVRSEDVTAHEVDGQTVAMVSVHRQMPNRGAEPVERLKNAQSVRVVPIVGRAGARLLELAESGGWLSGDGMGGPNTQPRLVRSWSAAGMEHPFRNLRNSWQTWMRWELRVPPWAIEPIMGHRVEGVTGHHYDRPGAELYAEVVAEAYTKRPFDANWKKWDAV